MTPNYVACQCQHCKNNIEFDSNQIESAGQTVACPHCGLETRIFAAPPKITAPPKLQKPGSVSRLRVWIFAGVFLGSTILLFIASGLMSFPADQENDDAKKISALETQEDALHEKSDSVLHQVTMYQATWEDYSNVNNQVRDLFDQRIKLQAEKNYLSEQRNENSNLALIASIFCCLFWIPASIYLFLVPKK
jgi:DNA-directed RNA polymerase subunit RPC12/RpoP